MTATTWPGEPYRGAGPGQAGRRREVLGALRGSASPLRVAQLAERLGMHPNTVRFHLRALVEAGQVERLGTEPAGPGRPSLAFRARQGMDPAGPRNYRLLAEILAASLAVQPEPAAKAIEAGRAWGARLADPSARGQPPSGRRALARLMGLLDELGFAPERRSAGGGSSIGLRHCPFLELAEPYARVVCPLHLGLMRGAMATLGAPVTVERLEAFVEPDLCLAHLSATTGTPAGPPARTAP